jgi:hypothetical protein
MAGSFALHAKILEEAQNTLEDNSTQMKSLLNLRIDANNILTVNIDVHDGLANESSGVFL